MKNSWLDAARRWVSQRPASAAGPRIGLALGGGFARGIAHIGILRALEQHKIPVHCIAGVSAGSIVAASYASGASPGEIERIARSMRFKDVARWTLSRMGLAGSERMTAFLARLLKCDTFESMKIPLAVVATNLTTGVPAIFRDRGDVVLPIRASCSYPGLFLPVRYQDQYLVDGNITMEVPTPPLRSLGATHVIAVSLPNPAPGLDPQSMFSVVNRCFQILTGRTSGEWRRHSNLVITPDVRGIEWDSFESASELIRAGEAAALAALPAIRKWFPESGVGVRANEAAVVARIP